MDNSYDNFYGDDKDEFGNDEYRFAYNDHEGNVCPFTL